jgi:hypothetical protein
MNNTEETPTALPQLAEIAEPMTCGAAAAACCPEPAAAHELAPLLQGLTGGIGHGTGRVYRLLLSLVAAVPPAESAAQHPTDVSQTLTNMQCCCWPALAGK